MSLYHKITNSILSKQLNNPNFFTKCIIKIVSIIDTIPYSLDPTGFHVKRKEVCGDTYFMAVNGLHINNYDDLTDYIQRTQSGMSRKCPMLLLPLNDKYDPPLTLPPTTFNIEPHKKIRSTFNKVKSIGIDKTINKTEITSLIKNSIKNGDLILDNEFKQFLFKKALGINIENFDISATLTLYLILSNILPQKWIVPKKINDILDSISDLVVLKYNTTKNDSLTITNVTIQGIDLANKYIFEIMYQITKNFYLNQIRSELLKDNYDLLDKCIIESNRFIPYHTGNAIVETTQLPRNLNVNGKDYVLPPGTNIIRSIPVCLRDTKYFTKEFNPYINDTTLIKNVVFNGLLDDNPNNRCCLFFDMYLPIIRELLREIIINYNWDSVKVSNLKILNKLRLVNFRKIN